MAQCDGGKGQAMAQRRRGPAWRRRAGEQRSKRVSGTAVSLTRRVVCGSRWREKKQRAGDEIEKAKGH
jgi:hypothetical protein